MFDSVVQRILRASVYDVAQETPLQLAPRLSSALGCSVLIKREDLQPTFSFKLRGAYNRMRLLSAEAKARGVIAASAGNHAQGVALAAEHLGVKACIVMPTTTPSIKVRAVLERRVEVVLFGDTFDEAARRAKELERDRGLTFVHPYDDLDVIAGQGTVAVEILRQSAAPPECVFVPVGGGGLIAGIGCYLRFVHPETRVIGVEPEDAASLQLALKNGAPTRLERVGMFADGVAVREVGLKSFELARAVVDEVVTVSTDEICAAIKDLFDDTRSVAEPSGALAVAGLKRYAHQHSARGSWVAIESGANMNFDRLRHVAERAEVGEDREQLIGVTIPEVPGAFLNFCRLLGSRVVTEFNYRYSAQGEAHIFVGLAMPGRELPPLMTALRGAGHSVVDMTDNEMAKLHLRYMVGGRAQVDNELMVRFEFPERPRALLDFLIAVGCRWNISLFHYRNHGAAFGRVLVGMQVSSNHYQEFRASLEQLGFRYAIESGNPAADLFLK